MTRRGVAAAVLVAAGLGAVVVLGGGPGDGTRSLDPRSTGPDGTRALVELLERLGATVDIVDEPPAGADVSLVLRDRSGAGGDESRRRLLAWARSGGTLVVADPRSPLTPEVVDGGDGLGLPADGAPLAPGACDMDELAGLGTIEPDTATLYRVREQDRSCFGSSRAAFVVARPIGSGRLVAVGNPSPFTNDRLGDADDAVLAVALLLPDHGARVAVLDLPPPGGGDQELVDIVPDPVWRALAQLGVAFVLFAAWRGRRLGRPVVEAQAVDIDGSELTRAAGRLLERRRDAAAAAATLRSDARTALATRLGVGLDASPAQLADAVAARTGLDAGAVAATFASPVSDDAALVELARRLDDVRQEVLT